MKNSNENPEHTSSVWLHDFKNKLFKIRLLDAESATTLFTSLLVGIGAGLGAVLFRRLIDGFQHFAYHDFAGLLGEWQPLHLILIPALGGAIVGPLVYYYAREAKGHGVPEVMEALELKGGKIRPRVVVVKALASSVCIASGGSVGREGPIVQIGSALGSFVGQALKLNEDKVRTLVACGAAGGVAATFNAPIAGAVFALEVLLRRFGSVYFGAVVISAVTADVIAHYFEGDKRTFSAPEYALNSPWELLLYTLMGVITALFAVGFSRLLYFSEDVWAAIKIPEPAKPAIGGILLGILGIVSYQVAGFPRIFSVGYGTIEDSLFSQLPLQITLSLLFLKLIATTLTLGSGGSGGVFAPSLFMGAMLGASFGQISHILFPDIVAPAGAYALVGMAAFFSGTAHAPITAILILFEMTGDYQIILPLMLSTVVSTIVSRNLSEDSIYTLKLKRRGVELMQETQAIDLMQGVNAGLAMNRETHAVSLKMPLNELHDVFLSTHYHALPVVENEGQLVGVITINELEQAQQNSANSTKIVADIMRLKKLAVIYPYQPVWMALKHLEEEGRGCVPVVSEDNKTELLGVLRRIDIIRAYNKAISKQAQEQHHHEILNIRELNETGLTEITLQADSPVAGRKVKELQLGDDSLMVSIRRNGKLRVVRGDTVLQVGDQITLFAEHPQRSWMEKFLNGHLEDSPILEADNVYHREVEIPMNSSIHGTKIHELKLPKNCVLVRLLRDQKTLMPRGDTVLMDGDKIEIIGKKDQLDEAELCLKT